jgi:hypothetical protein
MAGQAACIDMRRNECRNFGEPEGKGQLGGLETKRRIVLNHS